MRDVLDHQRLVDIHFEIAAGAAEADGDVIRHHLDGDHRQGFGLGWIDLARHNRRAGLVLGNQQFGESGAWAAGHQPDVVADLIERDRKRAECARKLYQCVMRALHSEFVRSANKRQARKFCNLGGGGLREARRRIDPGTDCGAAEGQAIYSLERVLDSFEIIGQHASVARPFLAQGNWGRVLHMRSSDLDDVVPFLRFGGDRGVQGLHRWNEALRHVHRGSNVHRGRKTVVRRLRHVDVIIGVNRLLAAERRSRELTTSIGDNFVHIHVELSAAAGHPDVQWEHVVMLAIEDFVANPYNQLWAGSSSRLPA
jgi:hypothetical protein